MRQQEAERIYQYYAKRAEAQLNDLGNDPQAINAFITNTYVELSKTDTPFLWFPLATKVSSTVGKSIYYGIPYTVHPVVYVPIIGPAIKNPSDIIVTQLIKGNQAVFKDMVPLFQTYEAVGIKGIELLAKSDIDNPFRNDKVLNAMKDYASLQALHKEIASSLGLSLNDPKVIEQLFSEQSNIDLSREIAMGILNQEQGILQEIYDSELLAIMLDPYWGWFAHQASVDGITILGKTYILLDYIENPGDINQRLGFANKLLEDIGDGIVRGEFAQFQVEVLTAANHTLWMNNPYNRFLDSVAALFWASEADKHDQKVKDNVLAFLNNKEDQPILLEDTALKLFSEQHDIDIFPTVLTEEHHIAKIHVDPLSYFLFNNPNYEVIAKDFNELWNSPDFTHTAMANNVGTILWNRSVMPDHTYIKLYHDGVYHYDDYQGEVRGINFPLIFDKTTNMPLTMPLIDKFGNYDQSSTIDHVYSNFEVFNSPTYHIWNNIYYAEYINNINNAIIAQKNQAFINFVHKNTVGQIMNTVMAPVLSFDNTKYTAELKISDILSDTGNTNLSHLAHVEDLSNHGLALGIELDNGSNYIMKNGMHYMCNLCTTDELIKAISEIPHI